MPEAMHGARPTHEAQEVSVFHALEMESAQLAGLHGACLSIDWSKFFSTIHRNIGNKLIIEHMDHEETTDGAHNYFNAERRLVHDARYRFKLGRSVEKDSTQRRAGYFEGPSYSIAVALSLMAVWTKS
eukprot:1198561-Pyramimonas_sp.AAC.1